MVALHKPSPPMYYTWVEKTGYKRSHGKFHTKPGFMKNSVKNTTLTWCQYHNCPYNWTICDGYDKNSPECRRNGYTYQVFHRIEIWKFNPIVGEYELERLIDEGTPTNGFTW